MLLRGISIIQAKHEAGTGHGFLNRSIHACGLRQIGRLKNGWRDIDHMRKLAANLALTVDTVRPVNDHAVAGAAKVGGNLLGPLKRCIKGHRPTCCHMRKSIFAAPLVKTRQKIFDLFLHLIEVGHLVIHADETTLGAGAVVTRDVNDDGVV